MNPDQGVTYYGWVLGEQADISRLCSFGFTGEMIPKTCFDGVAVIEFVNASPEVMEKACKEWPKFNWRSFTAIDKNGNQLPAAEQVYWHREAAQ